MTLTNKEVAKVLFKAYRYKNPSISLVRTIN